MKINIFLNQRNQPTKQNTQPKTKNIHIKKAEEVLKHIKGKTPTEINVFDKTKKQSNLKKTKIPINNHINKTGKNSLISKDKNKIEFYDMTNPYQKNNKGVITTCLGDRYSKEYKKFKNPSTFICQVVYILKSEGYTKIKGWLIPSPE